MPSLLLLREDIRGSGVRAPHFLDLGNIWRSAVSLTLRTHYLVLRLPVTHQTECQLGLAWKLWRSKKPLAPAGNRRPILIFPAHSLDTIAVWISQLFWRFRITVRSLYLIPAQFLSARGRHFTSLEFPRLPLRKSLL